MQCRACCMKLVFIEESCVSCITELPGRTWRTPANNFHRHGNVVDSMHVLVVMDKVPKNTLWPQTFVKKSKRMGKTQGKFCLELSFRCCDISAPQTKGTQSSKGFKTWKFHHLHSATSRTSLKNPTNLREAVPSVAALALGCLELQAWFDCTMIPGYFGPNHSITSAIFPSLIKGSSLFQGKAFIDAATKKSFTQANWCILWNSMRLRFVPVLFVCVNEIYHCC